MKSLVLKYRPKLFRDLRGQKINAEFLSKLIMKGQIGRNLILYGFWGASKTSTTRIYARALNCLNPSSDGEPCNQCSNCLKFFNGEFFDYFELDGATQGAKEKIKELVEFVKFPPMFGKYRVINIDEAHNLTKQAWDALLKIIEEPPPYLIFIFTTTEVKKIPKTIRSRCFDREVKLLSVEDSRKYLIEVCNREGFIFDEKALDIIIFLSGGHARDLIKNLEQASLFGDILIDNVLSLFDMDYIKDFSDFVLSLMSGDLDFTLKKIKRWSINPKQIFNLLNAFLIKILCLNYRGFHIELNPLLSYIPKEVFNKVELEINKFSNKYEIDSEVILDKILNKFTSVEINSYLDLISFVINLYNFMFLNKFDIKEKTILKIDKVDRKGTSKKGREFIDSFKKTKDILDNPNKIKPYMLNKMGFNYRKKSDLKIGE